MADRYDRAARRARLRLAAIGVVVVAALAAGGVFLVENLGPDHTGDNGHHAAPTPTPRTSSSAGASSASPSSGAPTMLTPAQAKPVKLRKPTGQKNGVSIGFPDDGLGAISAAVYHMDELSLLDDDMLRRQLSTITAHGSEPSIDKAVSDTRALRAAVGLQPSGGMPAGLTISTSVDAVRGKSITPDGQVVQVWMHYSRSATLPDAKPDDRPLRDQTSDVLMIWQDGDWKITTDPQYMAKRTFPLSYDPNSVPARADGWWEVIRED
ncbi:hypothetical protein ACGF07_31990 [Kitasatospora sp. NPDC048194]|uniref:hypothetical protein n=1 Tax=Kitasatospora sp. NPDC048194 TaxID=3364045 RepID=UPI003712AE4C